MARRKRRLPTFISKDLPHPQKYAYPLLESASIPRARQHPWYKNYFRVAGKVGHAIMIADWFTPKQKCWHTYLKAIYCPAPPFVLLQSRQADTPIFRPPTVPPPFYLLQSRSANTPILRPSTTLLSYSKAYKLTHLPPSGQLQSREADTPISRLFSALPPSKHKTRKGGQPLLGHVTSLIEQLLYSSRQTERPAPLLIYS